jgi:hypothetical protein
MATHLHAYAIVMGGQPQPVALFADVPDNATRVLMDLMDLREPED